MVNVTNFLTNNIKLWLIASLTLGLAPFNPPHVWGKIKWVIGGAKGMELIDWFDLFMHGTPWLLLVCSIVILSLKKRA